MRRAALRPCLEKWHNEITQSSSGTREPVDVCRVGGRNDMERPWHTRSYEHVRQGKAARGPRPLRDIARTLTPQVEGLTAIGGLTTPPLVGILSTHVGKLPCAADEHEERPPERKSRSRIRLKLVDLPAFIKDKDLNLMVFLHRTLGRPLRQSETPLRQSGRLFSRCAGFFRQSDSCRAGALSAQTIPTVARATPTVQPARHLRVPTTRSTRPLSRTPIPGFPAQTPSIRQESDGNPGIQVQMVAQARQVTDTRATSDGRTGGQHSNGPTITRSIPHTQRILPTRGN